MTSLALVSMGILPITAIRWPLRPWQALNGLNMASEFKFDLRFESSNLYYPGIHVHVAPTSHFGGL